MKNSHKKLSVPLLAFVCLFAGCAQTQQQGPTGFPVRVGVQGEEPLPVKLQTGPNDLIPVALVFKNGQVLPVEARLKVDEKIPVEIVVAENKSLPVNAKIQSDETLPVKLIPDRAIWIMVAIACLMAFFTMVSAVASCHAAINARRAAEKQAK
jgi:hypothetical protein